MDNHQHNLLLSLAWLWMADAEQLRRLHFPSLALKTVKNKLTDVRDLGLIESQAWGTDHGQALAMWKLTAKGHRTISGDPAYPGKPPSRSPTLFAHDRRALDITIRIIELAREKGLAGIRVWREVKLDPKRTRPKADALVIFEVGGESLPNTVPWSLGKPLDHEALWRVAIESDNHTQSMQVLAQKAEAYKLLANDPEWRQHWIERFGALPLVCVGTDTQERAALIARTWEGSWQKGHWAITHDEALVANKWTYRYGGRTRPISLSFSTQAEIAARNQAEEQKKQEAWEALPPRPLAELTRILSWRDGEYVRFGTDGHAHRFSYAKQQNSRIAIYQVGFNPAEQKLWLAYEKQEQQKADEKFLAARRERNALKARVEADRLAAIAAERSRRWQMWVIMTTIVILIVGTGVYIYWQAVVIFGG